MTNNEQLRQKKYVYAWISDCIMRLEKQPESEDRNADIQLMNHRLDVIKKEIKELEGK